MEALEKQYANVLSPLREILPPKKPYVVPDEVSSNTFFLKTNENLFFFCFAEKFILSAGAAGHFIKHYEENA